MNALAVHWEPGESPSAEQWQELESIVSDHPAQWMIWEEDPSTATVERLRELGIQSVVYTPCANSPSDGDLLSAMYSNVAALRSIEGRK
jgi:zinc transport system substrate-binding protein